MFDASVIESEVGGEVVRTSSSTISSGIPSNITSLLGGPPKNGDRSLRGLRLLLRLS